MECRLRVVGSESPLRKLNGCLHVDVIFVICSSHKHVTAAGHLLVSSQIVTQSFVEIATCVSASPPCLYHMLTISPAASMKKRLTSTENSHEVAATTHPPHREYQTILAVPRQSLWRIYLILP